MHSISKLNPKDALTDSINLMLFDRKLTLLKLDTVIFSFKINVNK